MLAPDKLIGKCEWWCRTPFKKQKQKLSFRFCHSLIFKENSGQRERQKRRIQRWMCAKRGKSRICCVQWAFDSELRAEPPGWLSCIPWCIWAVSWSTLPIDEGVLCPWYIIILAYANCIQGICERVYMHNLQLIKIWCDKSSNWMLWMNKRVRQTYESTKLILKQYPKIKCRLPVNNDYGPKDKVKLRA